MSCQVIVFLRSLLPPAGQRARSAPRSRSDARRPSGLRRCVCRASSVSVAFEGAGEGRERRVLAESREHLVGDPVLPRDVHERPDDRLHLLVVHPLVLRGGGHTDQAEQAQEIIRSCDATPNRADRRTRAVRGFGECREPVERVDVDCDDLGQHEHRLGVVAVTVADAEMLLDGALRRPHGDAELPRDRCPALALRLRPGDLAVALRPAGLRWWWGSPLFATPSDASRSSSRLAGGPTATTPDPAYGPSPPSPLLD